MELFGVKGLVSLVFVVLVVFVVGWSVFGFAGGWQVCRGCSNDFAYFRVLVYSLDVRSTPTPIDIPLFDDAVAYDVRHKCELLGGDVEGCVDRLEGATISVSWYGGRVWDYLENMDLFFRDRLSFVLTVGRASCSVVAKSAKLVVEYVGCMRGMRVYNITLVLEDGVAICYDGVEVLPSCTGCSWSTVETRIGNATVYARATFFETLNLTGTVLVDERGFAYTLDGRPIGSFVFVLPEKRSMLLLYSFIPYPIAEFRSGCGFANLVYVDYVDGSTGVVRKIVHSKLPTIYGVVLASILEPGVEPDQARDIERVHGSGWSYLPPFIEPIVYFEHNKTICKLCVNDRLLKELYSGDGQLRVVEEKHSVGVGRYYLRRGYEIVLGGNCYCLTLNAGIVNATYRGLVLERLSVDASREFTGGLGSVLPSVVVYGVGIAPNVLWTSGNLVTLELVYAK